MISLKKCIMLCFFVVCFFIPFNSVYADSLGLAPLNPAFIQYQIDLQNGAIDQAITSDGYYLGEIPSPVEDSFIEVEYMDQYFDSRTIPASYDLRTYNRVSPIRDQSTCGSCWTFAAMASAESLGLPSDPMNFSEQDMNVYHGFDPAECAGGNDGMSTAYLTRWDGPKNESDYPYPFPETYNDIQGPGSLPTSVHVEEIIKIPARTSYTDNNTIKQFVMSFGAVYVSFYYDAAYISPDDESFYNNTNTTTNHAVAVIGWDDNYSRLKFKKGAIPPSDGAFLIRNSWGTSRHTDGYFWISYYDKSFKPRVSYTTIKSKDNYKDIYQYDPLGWVGSWGSSAINTLWGANIFEATSNDKIAAVGFHTTDPGTNYIIHVYTKVLTGKPTTGTLAATVVGTETYAGYHTIVLPTSVAVKEGEYFSVITKIQVPSGGYPLAVEYINSGYSTGAMSHRNESFYSLDGISWTDYYTGSSALKVNNCIKAFTESTFNYYIPVFKYQPDHWAGLGVTNLSSTSSATVTVSVYNQTGTLLGTDPVRTIAAGGQDAFTVGLTLASNGWIKVSSTERLAGLSFLGQDDATVNTKMYIADLPFVENPSKSMIIPHVADNANWDTILYIANPNSALVGATLTYTNKLGVSSTPYTALISANGSKEIAVDIIAGSTDVRGGYVTITALKGLAAFALYHNLKTDNYSFAGINAVDLTE